MPMCQGLGSSPTADADAKTDWRASEDHQTLSRAADIRQDPARMASVLKHHALAKKSLASVGKSLSGRRRSS